MKSRLNPGENIILVSRIRLPKTYTNATSFFAVIIFVRLFDEIRNLLILKRVREQSQSLNFPLDRRMTVCVTERRILIWRVRRASSSLRFLGDVPRERIRSANNPYASHGSWKVVVIEIIEGHNIQLFIDANSSEAFSQLLNP